MSDPVRVKASGAGKTNDGQFGGFASCFTTDDLHVKFDGLGKSRTGCHAGLGDCVTIPHLSASDENSFTS